MRLRISAMSLSAILLGTSSAWIPQSLMSRKKYARRTDFMSSPVMMTDAPNDDGGDFEDDEECGEEEECEIDWSRMPGAVPDAEVTKAKVAKLEAQFNKQTQPDFEQVSSRRKHLEMNWQLQETADECNVYEPATCGGHVCDACSGTGQCACRFCRGTGSLYLTSTNYESGVSTPLFVSCSVCCSKGHEACKSCQGTGWIADWTDMGASVNP